MVKFLSFVALHQMADFFRFTTQAYLLSLILTVRFRQVAFNPPPLITVKTDVRISVHRENKTHQQVWYQCKPVGVFLLADIL